MSEGECGILWGMAVGVSVLGCGDGVEHGCVCMGVFVYIYIVMFVYSMMCLYMLVYIYGC